MARVAVIGEPLRIHGYGLPDAILCPATDQAEAVLAWRTLPDDIDLAVLTPSAARWLASEIARRPGVLPVLLAEAAATEPSLAPEPPPELTVRPDPADQPLDRTPFDPLRLSRGLPGTYWVGHPFRKLQWVAHSHPPPRRAGLPVCPEYVDTAPLSCAANVCIALRRRQVRRPGRPFARCPTALSGRRRVRCDEGDERGPAGRGDPG